MRELVIIFLAGVMLITPSVIKYEEKAKMADTYRDEAWNGFLADEIPAYYKDGETTFYYSDLDYAMYDEGTKPQYTLRDYDNDGESEMWIQGDYGGIFLDNTDGKISVFEEGEGTVSVVAAVQYESAYWIEHCDLTHSGRQTRLFTKYEGADNIVDTFELNAEYWDSDTDQYDENSDFTYRGRKITMEEYEDILSKFTN